MSTHRCIDRICAAAAAVSVLLAVLFMNGSALGLRSADRVMGYEQRLFDPSRVHTVDIVMDGWERFLEDCENEMYSACSVVIDGEAFKNVGLRAKGNTSLSTVSALGSDRYSFKLEFDQYESGKSYHGLDKLCLNNLIQDNTYMKDYLVYRLMAEFGAAAPLCSFAYITVNGEDWGLYLAVEGVEESFLQRNYGSGYGELYKPDSMSFGGGRGNGQAFEMEDFLKQNGGEESGIKQGNPGGMPGLPSGVPEEVGSGADGMQFGGNTAPEGFDPAGGTEGMLPSRPFGGIGLPGADSGTAPEGFNFGGGMMGGMGSDDVKLKYAGDDPDSYGNIFDNAKTDVSDADRARLIQSLRILGEGTAVEDVLDLDQVLRYFVVHNFVVNGDSYTGSMVHNYYLYEENGRLSMIPWDYNLAFGTFQSANASSAVNDPIDSPLSVTGSGDRPMADWIWSSEEYTALYHRYFQEFLDGVDCAAIIDEVSALIAPYVEKDPTKFCTYEEFQAGTETLKRFCTLREESAAGQLAGSIPSTRAGQSADSTALVDASELELSDMGTMNNGGIGGDFPGVGAGRGEQGVNTPADGWSGATPGEWPSMEEQRPEGTGLGGGAPENVPPGTDAARDGGAGVVLTVGSAVILGVGLLIVSCFRRRG